MGGVSSPLPGVLCPTVLVFHLQPFANPGLDGAVGSPVCWEGSLPTLGGWGGDKVTSKVPSKPRHCDGGGQHPFVPNRYVFSPKPRRVGKKGGGEGGVLLPIPKVQI